MSDLVPEGWGEYKIKDAANPNDRYSFTGGPFGSDLKSEDYTDNGVRIIQLQNIGDGAFKNKYKIYTSEAKADALHSCNIYPNDIILSKMGDPVARAVIIPDLSPRYVMASDGIRLAINKEKFNTKFIHDTINSVPFRNQAELNSTGSTRKRIGLTQLRELTFVAPPLPEQQKIAAILTSVDEVIEKTQAQIAKLKDLKTAMMQELLTRGVGVDGKPHTEFKDSPVGRIPKGWEVVKFDDIATSITCGVAAKPVYVDAENGVPFLSAQNVANGNVLLAKYRHISPEFHTKLTKNTKPHNGDILYSRVGANYGEAAVIEFDWEFSVYVSLTLIKLSKRCVNYFIKYLLNSAHGKDQAQNGVFAGGGVPNLNVAVVKAFDIALPSLDEQTKISNALLSIDKKLDAVTAKLNASKNTKKALMQDLLTGKVRVKVAS